MAAGTVIRGMYNYCLKQGVLSDKSKDEMRDYFSRVSKLRSGRGKRKAKKSKAKI